MARTKRDSKALVQARLRLQGMRAIDPALQLGEGLSVEAVAAQCDALDQQLRTYNETLSSLDGMLNRIREGEKALAELSSRILSAVRARYGNDADEVEKVGGVRRSERRRPARRAAAADSN